MPHKRVLIKLSGEMLLGDDDFGIDPKACSHLAGILQEIANSGHETAVVIGGGNIFRGLHLEKLGIERTPADHMGMLATLLNGVALQQALQGLGSKTRLITALECPKVAETYNWYQAQKYLSQGEILVFVGGTGSPYFTTDTAAALRASEMKVDILLKATKVNGVYDKDPHKFPEAKRYSEISYTQYLAEKLGVMDATAVALCMSNKIPIFVFNMDQLGKTSIKSLLAESSKYGTYIH
jgi:uridylate kinase